MLLLLACTTPASDADIRDAGLDVQLDAGWATPEGHAVSGPKRAQGAQQIVRPVVVPDGWDRGPIALSVDGSGWLVRAQVDGVEVARDEGGAWPARLDLTGKLPAGAHRLGLSIEPASEENVPGGPISAWTFRVPQKGLSQWGGQARLRFGAAATMTPRLVDSPLSAALVGGDGAVHFTAVRDGTVLARWDDAATWDGPTWPEALVWIVAEDEAGHRWQVRTGLRSVQATAEGLIAINGEPRYLAARRVELVHDGSVRTDLFRQLLDAARAGDNAAEWHGEVLSGAGIDVLDELGVPLIGVPRCAGRRQHDGRSGRDDPRDVWLADRDERAAAVWASHPSAVAWAIEYQHPGVHPSFSGYRAMGLPFFDTDRARAIREDEPTTARLPPWIIELPWTASRPDYAERVAALLQAHRQSGGAGMEVPLPDPSGAFSRLIPGVLEGLGVQPWVPDIPRRGPATVVADVGIAGTLVLLEVPEQPPVATFADSRGTARIELDYAGPATIRTVGGSPLAITLTPGTWRGDGWHESLTTVRYPP